MDQYQHAGPKIRTLVSLTAGALSRIVNGMPGVSSPDSLFQGGLDHRPVTEGIAFGVGVASRSSRPGAATLVMPSFERLLGARSGHRQGSILYEDANSCHSWLDAPVLSISSPCLNAAARAACRCSSYQNNPPR